MGSYPVVSMMRLLSVVFIVFVCGLLDVRGWTEYQLNQMSNSGEKWDIYCCDDNGRAVQTWCGSWNGWYRECCDVCFWYGSADFMSDCQRDTSDASTWQQRRQAEDHCWKVHTIGPWYCDPWFWGRKKRSATSNQTIVSPTVSGIKKFKKDKIPTDFKTRTWMSGKNRKGPTEPESKNEITWMSGIKKNWNKKGKKTITWDGVPRDRPAFNQTITDAAFNQTVTKNQRYYNDFSCGTSMTVDMRPCKYRVRTKRQMRRMQCPCCLLPSKKREICGSRSCPCY